MCVAVEGGTTVVERRATSAVYAQIIFEATTACTAILAVDVVVVTVVVAVAVAVCAVVVIAVTRLDVAVVAAVDVVVVTVVVTVAVVVAAVAVAAVARFVGCLRLEGLKSVFVKKLA